MASLFEKRAAIPDSVMFRELEGESVLLNIDTETYFGLDDVGTRFWIVLKDSDSIQDAYEILLDEYEVDPDSLREDLEELLAQLVEKGLLVLHDVSADA